MHRSQLLVRVRRGGAVEYVRDSKCHGTVVVFRARLHHRQPLRHIPRADYHPSAIPPVPHPLPADLPRSGGPLIRAFGRAVLRLMRWRIEGTLPNVRKLVVIVAPHTTNWDFIVGLAAKFALGLRARWLGKHTLFRGPAGLVFRALGGIPVDRRAAHDVVSQAVREFEHSERMVLAIAPEGTRKGVERWKTGFWHIARGAAVPILQVVLDRERRILRIGAIVPARGEVEEQVREIRSGMVELLRSGQA